MTVNLSSSSRTKGKLRPELDGCSACFIAPAGSFSASDVRPNSVGTSIDQCMMTILPSSISRSLVAPPSELALGMGTSPSDGSAGSEVAASLVPGNSSSMTTGFFPFFNFLRGTTGLESFVLSLRSSFLSGTQPWSIRRNSAMHGQIRGSASHERTHPRPVPC